MKVVRMLLALLSLVAMLSIAPSTSIASSADSAQEQGVADRHCECPADGDSAQSGACGSSGCVSFALPNPGLQLAFVASSRAADDGTTPMSSLSVAPETAPPKHFLH